MSVIGDALSVGGGSSSSDALLRVKSANGCTVTASKGQFSRSTSIGKSNGDDYSYYISVPSREFSESSSFSVSSTNGSNTSTGTKIVSAAEEYDMYLGFGKLLFMDGVFDNSIGGFTMLQGTVSAQTDTGVIVNGEYVYTENDNDYGVIISNNAFSVAGYSKLHVVIPSLTSWQDFSNNFYAKLYLIDSRYTKPTRADQYGIGTFTGHSYIIDDVGTILGGHIIDQSYDIHWNVDGFSSSGQTFWFAISCASGVNTGIPHGIIKLARLELEI